MISGVSQPEGVKLLCRLYHMLCNNKNQLRQQQDHNMQMYPQESCVCGSCHNMSAYPTVK